MQLTDEQKTTVASWVAEGMKVSEVQDRIATEFGTRLTYMEVRFLIDDLKVMPKDVPVPDLQPLVGGGDSALPNGGDRPFSEGKPPAGGGINLKVDSITRPGAVVSGKVTFSDGTTVDWHLDQMGRLGMVPPQPGYRPPQNDVAEFQVALEKELMKLGM
ncbi:MAG: hypothetical protein M3463_01950 [Verrucomicrobiota bacterium]|nr:hypothetical protein [Verrucomicrobiota bacterium]